MESRFPPCLVEVLLDAGDEEAYERRLQEALERGCVPKREEVDRWRLEDRRSLWVLGPVPCEPGTYRHWDLVQKTFERMAALGWIPPETGREIRAHLLAARGRAFSEDRREVAHSLSSVGVLLDRLPAGPGAEAALAFFSAHDDLLRERPCPPSGPFLSLSPLPAQASLGEEVFLRAALRDQATLAPLSGRSLLLEVLEGPRRGWRETAVTDEKGEALFSLKGSGEGREEIHVGLPAEGSVPPTPCVVKVSLLWSKGPNLRVYGLSPERFWGRPGERIRIHECTTNAGEKTPRLRRLAFGFARRMGESSGSPSPEGLSRRWLRRNRAVSTAPTSSFPLECPRGKYLLEAEADARGQVVETEEGDNRFVPFPGSTAPPSHVGIGVSMMQAFSPAGGAPPGPKPNRKDAAASPRTPPVLPPPPAGTVALLQGPLSGSLGEGERWGPVTHTPCREKKEDPAGMAFSAGMETYACPREELPQGLLRQVVGKVTVTWYRLEMEHPAPHPDHADFATWEPVPVPIYREGASGFELQEEVPATRLGPFGFTRWNEGASLTFFATARKGEFVETVLFTRTGERAWLRLREPKGSSTGPFVSYICLTGQCGEAEEGSGHPDGSVLNPHPVLRLHVAPDPRSPWIPFQRDDPFLGEEALEKRDVDTWGLYMGEQIGGFVRIFVWGEETTGGWRGTTVGWLPIRDRDGALLLWPVDYFC